MMDEQITENGKEKDTTQLFIFIGLVAFMFSLPVPQYLAALGVNCLEVQAIIMRIFLVYFCLVLGYAVLKKKVCFQKNQIAYLCIAGLVVLGILSVCTAANKNLALYGSIWRREGFTSILLYYLIFTVTSLLKVETYRRWLIRSFLALSVIVSVTGIVQFAGIYEFVNTFPGMASVPMGNPNFFASFSVIFTGTAIGGFFLCDKETKERFSFFSWKRWGWYVLVLLGYAACISADSSVVYVGLIMIFLMYLFLEYKTKRRKFMPLLLLLLGLIAVVILLNAVRDGIVFEEITSVGNQIKDQGSIFGDSVGTTRMLVYKRVIHLLPVYGLAGCGIDHLGDVWKEKYGVNSYGVFYDKAHNEYLDLWISEGIFSLILYIIFLFALFISGIRRFVKKKQEESAPDGGNEISKIVFFAFFGYIAQAFFNIRVIQVAPYFYMICGLLYGRKKETDEETKDC